MTWTKTATIAAGVIILAIGASAVLFWPPSDKPIARAVPLARTTPAPLPATHPRVQLDFNLTFEQEVGDSTATTRPAIHLAFRPQGRTAGALPQSGDLAEVVPGFNSIDVGMLPEGRTYLNLRADGYSPWLIPVSITNGAASTPMQEIALFRTRYVTVRYAFNTARQRDLTGPDVVEGRVALTSSGGLPFFGRDWMMSQLPSADPGTFGSGAAAVFRFHRMAEGFGLAEAPAGSTYEQLTQAPAEASAYSSDSIEAKPGLILFGHVNGDTGNLGYGKVVVEQVSLTPPQGVLVYSTVAPTPPPRRAAAVARTTRPTPLTLNLAFEQIPGQANAKPNAPIRLHYSPMQNLPGMPRTGDVARLTEGANIVDLAKFDNGQHLFWILCDGFAPISVNVEIVDGHATASTPEIITLYRTRYVIVRWVFNLAHQRDLAGSNLSQDRVALTSGAKLPHFGDDWGLLQCEAIPEGQYTAAPASGPIPALRRYRFSSGCGLAAVSPGTTFEQMEQAPADDQYQQVAYLEARAGAAYYCHVGGVSGNSGYGKFIIDDVTLTKPQGIKVLYNWVR